MKTSDKFAIATFVSVIPVGIAMGLKATYEKEASFWLLLLCICVAFFFDLVAQTAEENEREHMKRI